MKKVCDKCKKTYDAEEVLHCSFCSRCYCPSCSDQTGVCGCYGDLEYYQ